MNIKAERLIRPAPPPTVVVTMKLTQEEAYALAAYTGAMRRCFIDNAVDASRHRSDADKNLAAGINSELYRAVNSELYRVVDGPLTGR